MRRRKRDTLFLILALLLAAAVRLDLLIATHWVIDSDEGIVGLMAKHISEGSRYPIFYYGQHYMGSFEAFIAAALFKLFGISPVTLKLTPLLFSLAMVPLIYRLGYAVGGIVAARTAALLWALPPSPLVVWSSMARGGFIEVVWIGALATLLTLRWLRAERPRPNDLLLIGATLGFGWWVNNQTVYFLAPIAFVVGCRLLESQGQYLVVVVASGARALLGFMLGSLPFWVYNLQNSFASFGILHRAQAHEIPGHLAGLFGTALPMLLGAKRFWQSEDLFPGATGVVLGTYLILALAIVSLRAKQMYALFRLQVDRKAPVELFLLILLTALAAFALSSFGHLFTAPRYLLPIYLPLFVLTGYCVAALRRVIPLFSKGVPLLLLAVALCSCYLGGRAIPGQPFVAEGQRVSSDHSELIKWLEDRKITFIKTNYWIGYRLAFETEERIKFIRFKEPLDTRIPEYTTEGERIPFEKVPFVVVPSQAKTVKEALQALGYTFAETILSDYVVISDMISKGEGATTVSAMQLKTSASVQAPMSAQAIDQDLGTRWGSGTPQNPTLWFEIKPLKPRAIRGFTVTMGGWSSDFPRELEVFGTTPDGREVKLLSEDQYRSLRWLLPEAGKQFRVSFDPLTLSAIRFLQKGQDPVFDWSIAELALWE